GAVISPNHAINRTEPSERTERRTPPNVPNSNAERLERRTPNGEISAWAKRQGHGRRNVGIGQEVRGDNQAVRIGVGGSGGWMLVLRNAMTRVLVVLLTIAVVGAGAGAYYMRRGTAEVGVLTSGITRGDIVDTVAATGTLQAVTTVQVGSQVSGNISYLGADFNSIVKKGQVIARLDPSLFQTQVDQARANVLKAQAEVVQAQANVEHAKVTLVDAQQKYARAKML